MARALTALERILQSQGFGSRKACRALIREGRCAINQQVIDDPFAELPTEGLRFEVDGESWPYCQHVYVLLNKPAGYECSRSPTHHPSVLALLPEPFLRRGVQPAGRLDEDTTGLLLLSDDGEFIHRVISPRHKAPKRYRVRVRHALDAAQLAALSDGVLLRDETEPVAALACAALGERELMLTLGEGRYHQVKRMIAAAGNRVEALHREAVGGVEIPPGVQPGQWCWLDAEQVGGLMTDRESPSTA